jgi:hypothetical protein
MESGIHEDIETAEHFIQRIILNNRNQRNTELRPFVAKIRPDVPILPHPSPSGDRAILDLAESFEATIAVENH